MVVPHRPWRLYMVKIPCSGKATWNKRCQLTTIICLTISGKLLLCTITMKCWQRLIVVLSWTPFFAGSTPDAASGCIRHMSPPFTPPSSFMFAGSNHACMAPTAVSSLPAPHWVQVAPLVEAPIYLLGDRYGTFYLNQIKTMVVTCVSLESCNTLWYHSP